jgi:hypothetical protein
MRILFVFTFLVLQITASAQKEAYNWIWGTCFPEFGCDGIDDGLNGTGIMKFNDDSLESITTKYFPAPFSRGSATISDSLGNFLMAFNGKTLFDSSGNIIAEMNESAFNDVYFGYRGFVFLRHKLSGNNFKLIHSYGGSFPNSPNPYSTGIDTAIFVTYISFDEGTYTINSSERYDLPIQTVSGAIDACRHANGRDWWMLKLGHKKNQYIKGLLSPDTLTLAPYYTNQDSAYVSFGWASFSSDGSKYVHWFGGHIRELQVFDFDRCTGELSNLQTFDFSDIVIDEWFTDFTPFSLSPDGSKLYMTRTNSTDYLVIDNFQYDLETQTAIVLTDSLGIFSLTPNLKHMLGGFCCMNYTPEPNMPYASILKQPNEVGFDAEFIPFYYELPLYGFNYTPPNQANHLLGPVDGTVCDSLGLNDETSIKKLEQFSFNLFPNPGNEVIHFTTDLPLPLKLTIRDNQGRTVIEKTMNQKSFSIQEGIAELNTGIYFVELKSEKKPNRLVKKWMKME